MPSRCHPQTSSTYRPPPLILHPILCVHVAARPPEGADVSCPGTTSGFSGFWWGNARLISGRRLGTMWIMESQIHSVAGQAGGFLTSPLVWATMAASFAALITGLAERVLVFGEDFQAARVRGSFRPQRRAASQSRGCDPPPLQGRLSTPDCPHQQRVSRHRHQSTSRPHRYRRQPEPVRSRGRPEALTYAPDTGGPAADRQPLVTAPVNRDCSPFRRQSDTVRRWRSAFGVGADRFGTRRYAERPSALANLFAIGVAGQGQDPGV